MLALFILLTDASVLNFEYTVRGYFVLLDIVHAALFGEEEGRQLLFGHVRRVHVLTVRAISVYTQLVVGGYIEVMFLILQHFI